MKRELGIYTLESCMNGLALDIILSNIKQQIEVPQDISVDFLGAVADIWDDIQENCEDEEVIMEVKYALYNFWIEVIRTINLHFDLCMDYNSESMEVQYIAEELYIFFILERIENIENFFSNYINANKVVIAQTLDINEKGKDVTSIACRKRDVDKTSIPIIANIGKVISYITELDLEAEELLNFSEASNAEIIEDMYFDNTINNNFTHRYINNIMLRYDDVVSSRIRNNVRTKLYI